MDATLTSNPAVNLPLAARFSDALNPIVLKELRQAVQSRFVVTMLMVLLAIQLVAVGLYLIFTNPEGYDFTAGRTVFTILLGILLIVSLSFVPTYTAVRMIAERSDTDVDLLYITTIKPRSIIAGKTAAAAVLTGLIFSACLPFMTFTYFLRGIDLPTIFVLLALSFLSVQMCSMTALLVACLPFGRVVKIFLGLFVLNNIIGMFFAVLGSAISMMQFGVGSSLNSWEFWQPALAVLTVALSLWGLVYVLCVALITPLSANRALPVRGYLTALGGLGGAGVLLWSFFAKSHIPITIWQTVFCSLLALSFFAAVSERDKPGKRVARAIPAHPIRRASTFLLFSGAASGLIWTLAASAFTLGLAWIWRRSHPTYGDVGALRTTIIFGAGLLLYFYVYAVAGALLRRVWLPWLHSKWTWMVSSVLLTLGTVLPVIGGFFFYNGAAWWSWGRSSLFIGNPFVFGNSAHDKYYAGFALAFAVIMTLLNARWLWTRWQEFQPPVTEHSREGAAL